MARIQVKMAASALAAVTVLALFVSSASATAASSRARTPDQVPVFITDPITYMTDAYESTECDPPVGEGTTYNLHYQVIYPQIQTGVTHPILFAVKGEAFNDNARCTYGVNNYQRINDIISPWAQHGFVIVNIEYHSKNDGLYGDLTCPNPNCAQPWGNTADGVTELNLKTAVNYFFDHNPAQYGADESKGVVVWSTSSGANYGFLLGATSPIGTHKIDAVIGWSGLDDAALSGDAEKIYGTYIETFDTTTDQFNFGNPVDRISAGGPALWMSSSQGEIVDPASTWSFYDQCVALGISKCYLRIVDDGQFHALGYRDYTFKGPSDPNEVTIPQARTGMTVMRDSMCFAEGIVNIPDPKC